MKTKNPLGGSSSLTVSKTTVESRKNGRSGNDKESRMVDSSGFLQLREDLGVDRNGVCSGEKMGTVMQRTMGKLLPFDLTDKIGSGVVRGVPMLNLKERSSSPADVLPNFDPSGFTQIDQFGRVDVGAYGVIGDWSEGSLTVAPFRISGKFERGSVTRGTDKGWIWGKKARGTKRVGFLMAMAARNQNRTVKCRGRHSQLLGLRLWADRMVIGSRF